MTGQPADYAVLTVSYNSADELPGCLEDVGALAPPPGELCIVDCGSTDDSVAVAQRHLPPTVARTQVLPLGENLGFAGGMNRAVAATRAPWVLLLNPDARPASDYVQRLLTLASQVRTLQVGALTGRLLRPDEAATRRIDACGMRLVATWRHLDRASGQPDCGQLARAERVFGATGAASLFRREALDDVAVDGEVFDPRFHSFREDAELCFRLQERGWEVLYEPRAVAIHRRFNLPSRRTTMSPAVNYHSLKNRYLLRIYHQTPANLLWTLPATAARDLAALAWVLVRERSSLAAYRWLWQHRHELWARRRTIQQRRRNNAWAIDRWFLRNSLPLPTASPS